MYSWEGKADFIEAITAVFSVTLFLRNLSNFALNKYFLLLSMLSFDA